MPFYFLERLFTFTRKLFCLQKIKNLFSICKTLFCENIFQPNKKLHHFVIVSAIMDKHNLLHPPMNVKKFKGKDKALRINHVQEGKFNVFFVDSHFKRVSDSMDVPVEEFSKLLDSRDCRFLKAVFFFLIDDNNTYHTVNLDIRQMVYEEVRKRKWHLYLVDPRTNSILSMLFASKINSKPGDVILNVLSFNGQMVTVSEIHRKQNGYSYIGDRRINRFNRNINELATECLGTCDPKYVIVFYPLFNDLVTSLKSLVVPSKKVITVHPENFNNFNQHILKTIFEHGSNQLIPFCFETLAVTNESNITDTQQAVIAVDEYKYLPFEQIKIVPKSKMPYYVAYLDEKSRTYKPACKAQISKEKKGHRIKLALVVDRNSLPFLYQEPFIIPEIQALPKKLTSSKADLNVPVIAFFDNSSVICVRDENGYKFLNEWNGLYGNDLYLTFEPEEPIIFTDLNVVNDNDPFVVYDLVKILSMPANILKIDPKWGFKVISNSDNPVLLRFETFLGSRKATPVSLMVYLLKYHIKAIEKETGKKPKEVEFCLFNEFTNEEKNRIHTGLEEACNLLKIGFVIVPDV